MPTAVISVVTGVAMKRKLIFIYLYVCEREIKHYRE